MVGSLQHRVSKTVAFVVMLASVGAILLGLHSVVRFGVVGHRGASIYYDAYHCARHLWNQDNRRDVTAYHSVAGFARVLAAWRDAGFEVHVATEGFDREDLDAHDVFFVGEQTFHGRFMTEAERAALMAWVGAGGGLFVTAEHTNAYYMGDTFNRVVADLPVRARADTIADDGQDASPRDWIELPERTEHPITDGVDEYRFAAGASLDTPHGVILSSASSWSDGYDPTKWPLHHSNGKRDEGELEGPLVGVAAFEHGDGRVVALGDHNALSNTHLHWGDHHRFALNSVGWLAPTRTNPDLLWIAGGLVLLLAAFPMSRTARFRGTVSRRLVGSAAGVAVVGVVAWVWVQRPPAGFLVHSGQGSAMAYMSNAPAGYFTFYGQLTKEPHLRPWASRTLEPGHDALLLSAPTEAFDDEQMAIIKAYLDRGKTVAYLATVGSLESAAGRQLQEAYEFGVELDRELELHEGVTPFLVRGTTALTDSIYRVYVDGGLPGIKVSGLEPIVQLSAGGFHPRKEAWRANTAVFDLVSEKRVGAGRLVLLSPVELFDNQSLRDLYTDPDPIQGQMRELVIRLSDYALGR